MSKPPQTGQHLFTRDGRAIGNGIVIATRDDGAVRIETDFGNGGQWLSPSEVEAWWWTTHRDGQVRISDLDRWRRDRAEKTALADSSQHQFSATCAEFQRKYEAMSVPPPLSNTARLAAAGCIVAAGPGIAWFLFRAKSALAAGDEGSGVMWILAAMPLAFCAIYSLATLFRR